MALAANPEEMKEAVLKIEQERGERDMEKVVPVPQTDVEEVVRQVPRVMVPEVVKQVPRIQVLSESLRKLPSMCRELEEVVKHVPRVSGGFWRDRRDPRSPSRSPPLHLIRKLHRIAHDVRRVPPAGRVRTPQRQYSGASAVVRTQRNNGSSSPNQTQKAG